MISIALIGLGSAGRSRLKAVNENPNFQLAGIASRRSELQTITWDEVLKRDDIKAVAISTENTQHALLVKEALTHNKHVLCDYPLAFTASEASSLYQLAGEKKRILHTEHIGLLTKAHLQAKNDLQTMGVFLNGSIRFTAGWNTKLADPAYTGPLPFLALSRLVQAAELLGDLQIVKHKFICNSNTYKLKIELKVEPSGNILLFEEHRAENLPRLRRFEFTMEQGPLTMKAGVGNENLFGQDLAWFYERITHQKPCYYNESRMIKVIGQLEHIKTEA
ncbi:Gfo/Idh/MocA family oxidoreductase [bacterium]|nr:Gfo/Idh/MocA family oxidoreductase [bacterium]